MDETKQSLAAQLQQLYDQVVHRLSARSVVNFAEARLLCEKCNINLLTGSCARSITINFDEYLAGFRRNFGSAETMYRTSCKNFSLYVLLNDDLICCAKVIEKYEELRAGDANFVALVFKSCPFGIDKQAFYAGLSCCYDSKDANSHCQDVTYSCIDPSV